MKKKHIYALLLVLLVTLMLLPACRPAEPAADAPETGDDAAEDAGEDAAEADYREGKTVYLVFFLKGHPVIRLMSLGFIDGAEELGIDYKLLVSDGSDMAKMISDFEQAIAEGASGIVTWYLDPAIEPVIARAGEAGIPVISAHFPADEGSVPGLTAWVSTAPEKYAVEAARAIGNELEARGVESGSIAITQGSFNTVENLVAETFAATFNEEFPQFTPLESQEEGFDPPVAIAKAAAIIQANPDIVAGFSTTGAGPTTWARAAEDTGFEDGELIIISMDYTRPNLDLVQEGKVFALVGQPLYEEHREAVHVLDAIFAGEDFDYANEMPAPIITVADLDFYYELNDMVEQKLGAPEPEAAEEETEEADTSYREDKTVYLVFFLKGHPVIRLMSLGFIDGAEELGIDYKLLVSDGSDMAKMISDFEQAIAEGASGIVTWYLDPAIEPVIARAGEAGIPVISAHFPADEGSVPGLTAWVSTAPEKYAVEAARAIGNELEARGVESGSIAITQGSFNTVENLVAETFAATFNEEFPQFTPLESQEEGFDPPVAIAKAAAIIQANPDIVAGFSTTGAGPTTWARAAEDTGFEDGELIIISMDYTRPNLDLVQEGKVFALVGQPLYEEHREAVHVLDAIFAGEDFDYANEMPAPIITVDDLDFYYELNDLVEEKLGS